MSSVQVKQTEESLASERMSMYENMVENLVNSDESSRYMLDGKLKDELDIQLKTFPLGFLYLKSVIFMSSYRTIAKFAFNDD